MHKPKFTDAHKYPDGYRRAVDTDIQETFRRIRRRQQEQAAKKAQNEAEATRKLVGAIPARKARNV